MLNLIQQLHLLSLLLLSMSLYYQVMGSTKCPNPKPKKHAGVSIVPKHKPKEPYNVGDMVIFNCETTETSQSIKCLDTGKWNEIPYCPDPVNSTCPILGPLANGSHNSTGPEKVGSIVVFECNNDYDNYLRMRNNNSQIQTSQSQQDIELQIKFKLTGPKYLKCLPSSKWNDHMPTCLQVIPERTTDYGFMFLSALIILIPLVLFLIIAQLILKWKRRQQQRERWKQYFTDYKYRHSKTSITFGNNNSSNTNSCNNRPQSQETNIPVTDL